MLPTSHILLPTSYLIAIGLPGEPVAHTAGEDRSDLLHAELRETVCVAKLGELESVVEDVFTVHACSDVAESVELGPDLSQFTAHHLVVADDLTGALGSARWQSRHREAKMPVAEQRHPELVHAAELVDLPFLI